MKTYYNLKIGRSNKLGSVLVFDSSKRLEDRLEAPGIDTQWTVKFANQDQKGSFYNVINAQGEYVAMSVKDSAVAAFIENGKKDVLRIYVTSNGKMTLEGKTKAYLTELTQKEADDKLGDEANFRMLRDYIIG